MNTETPVGMRVPAASASAGDPGPIRLAILTAGKDPHYALGLLGSLLDKPLDIEFVGDDEMGRSPLVHAPNVRFFNLRGDSSPGASAAAKVRRIARYYAALLRYAATTRAEVFHVLWFNRFELFDNTLLIFWYRLLGKRIVYTAHNLSTVERNGRRSLLNHLSLTYLYRRCDHVIVHSEMLKRDLVARYGVSAGRVSALPFPLNNVTPQTDMTRAQARVRLALPDDRRTLLFFGNIAPYKGLDLLIEAMQRLPDCWLLVVGRLKAPHEYWREIQRQISRSGASARIRVDTRYVPEDEVEVYLKAADVVVVPYRRITQSAVVALSYSFGVPVIASDAGALGESVVPGVTGFVFRSGDVADLARAVERYFASDLFTSRDERRHQLVAAASERFSWDAMGDGVQAAYEAVTGRHTQGRGRRAAAR